jgi:hypothetical protein
MWACPLPANTYSTLGSRKGDIGAAIGRTIFVFPIVFASAAPMSAIGLTVFVFHIVFASAAPMSRFQLHSVKYVFAVDYNSMIGGYRTPVLVMNSVNPLLIPLRYLNHV